MILDKNNKKYSYKFGDGLRDDFFEYQNKNF